MSNKYLIKLTPLAVRTSSVDMRKSEKVIMKAINKFNTKSRIARNCKEIDVPSVKIEAGCIEFVLVSKACLEYPTRAVRTLISDLAKTSDFKPLIADRRLFHGDYEVIEEIQNEPSVTPISDEKVLLYEVARLLFINKDLEKINKIKEILTLTGDISNE